MEDMQSLQRALLDLGHTDHAVVENLLKGEVDIDELGGLLSDEAAEAIMSLLQQRGVSRKDVPWDYIGMNGTGFVLPSLFEDRSCLLPPTRMVANV